MKVLIACTDPVTRALLESAIRTGGEEPLVSGTGRDALAQVLRPDGPALLILDRTLPGEDALELCRQLRATPRGARAWVALLGAGPRSEVELIYARQLGAEVLTRPVDVTAVHRWLTRGRVVSGVMRASELPPGRWDQALVGSTIDDKYLVLRLIGSGGMGAVYEVRHLLVDEHLAFKVIHADLAERPRLRERFAREAKTMLRVVHPHAVAVRDCGETRDGLLYLTMDLSSGRTLRDVLDQAGPLPEARAVRIAQQIAGALTAAHAREVVHRDLKPDNVLHEEEDQVRVCDFGLAKLLDDTEDAVTGTGMVLGTPHYLAPEQASGRVEDGRCDVYALGCMLYELLSGAPPFQGRSAWQLMQAHASCAPVPLAQRGALVSPRLAGLVMRMLAKQPEGRPTAVEVEEALAALAARHTPVRSLHVLIADDSGVNRALLGGMLRGWGHRVALARDGEEAVALAECPDAGFDVIVLDGEMPRLDGPAAARRLRQRKDGVASRTPIVGMTSSEGAIDRTRCLAAGMDEVVQKPIRPEELAAALERVTLAALPGAPDPDADVFDRHAALERVEGDLDLLAETLGLLLDDLPRLTLTLRDAARRRDDDALARAAHELKGAAGNCALVSLARVASRVEGLCRSGQAERAAAELPALEREVGRANPVLARVAREGAPAQRFRPVA